MDKTTQQIDQLIAAYKAQIEELEKLKKSLAHGKQESLQPDARETRTYSQADVKRLEVEIAKAEKAGVETFVFRGDEYFVPYAKYMAEYLRQQLGMSGVS